MDLKTEHDFNRLINRQKNKAAIEKISLRQKALRDTLNLLEDKERELGILSSKKGISSRTGTDKDNTSSKQYQKGF